MTTLFLMVGLPGSGKTTLARRLEAEHDALRLTPDEWMLPLFGAGESGDRRWLLESELLWSVAARALGLGVNVILDYGCWARSERDLFRTRAADLGVGFELHVLNVPLDELWQRVDGRNRLTLPGVPHITCAELEEWVGWYQPPTPNELDATALPAFTSKVWSFQP